MTRYKLFTMTFAVVVGGLALSTSLLTAPPALANCNSNQQWDPINGTCWTKQDRNAMGTAQGANGCRPGEMGGCLGALQNATTPGATLPGWQAPDSNVVARIAGQ